ncbi:23S rRNA m(5)U-1939 methyltransferase [Desulforamulus reducens MI-1]|uniref:23S rRNA m(5)U-1939 methyltransferase n=1 Tax=Desulforamulus reducens (strain ATCC BAA-1160 / DSM 100696 / MI-1) TaxID=349161 RepID=A4J6R9_DESRM|nr:23S rRNA (uracil(1939)-C(5))-methyltransferase RlmD [Desulforamulus reducens]ABO50772.1 23S rRNA m(5)U-1939 methyltransferase [Desulforamulus reducens MI-1]
MGNNATVGDIVDLEIHGLGHSGEGVGRYQKLAVFVPGALIGERVRVRINQVKKSFARGQLVEILKQTTARIVPNCESYQVCGGCQLQHLDYQEQLTYKRSVVESALFKIGGLKGVEVLPTLGMRNPWHYRNKIHLQVKEAKGRIKLGFYAEGSYELAAGLAGQSCLLVQKEINQVIAILEELINSYKLTPYHWGEKRGLLRHVMIRQGFHSGQCMVVLVTSPEEWQAENAFSRALVARQPKIVSVIRNINRNPGRIVLGEENRVMYGKEYIVDELNGLNFNISANSFYQVNTLQTEELYQKAKEFAQLQGHERVIDAYCGIGTIALYLARSTVEVVGMEIVPPAVADAKENARLNGITNTKFFQGAVEKLLPRMAKDLKPDVVVLDPPRKGCEKEVLTAISESKVPRIVYVSCDPATLARDLGVLDKLGYQTLQVQPVDMFPWTYHVECVVLMSSNI